jgi:mono/diheme cytochrome c family protein
MLKNICLEIGYVTVFVLSICLVANPAEKGDPAKGKEVFAGKCTPCHGLTGHGDGPAAASLQPKPRDLSDTQYMSTLNDERMFKTISEGGAAVGKSPSMPSWKSSLSESDILNVIAYIRNDICKCQYKGDAKENK